MVAPRRNRRDDARFVRLQAVFRVHVAVRAAVPLRAPVWPAEENAPHGCQRLLSHVAQEITHLWAIVACAVSQARHINPEAFALGVPRLSPVPDGNRERFPLPRPPLLLNCHKRVWAVVTAVLVPIGPVIPGRLFCLRLDLCRRHFLLRLCRRVSVCCCVDGALGPSILVVASFEISADMRQRPVAIDVLEISVRPNPPAITEEPRRVPQFLLVHGSDGN